MNFLFALYRAESPSQVFIFLINCLLKIVEGVPPQQWSSFMCNLDTLLVAKKPLPLPAPFCNIWGSVQKIIDTFHLPNHKQAKCHETYNPDKMKAFAPHYNTQSCEQTFAWLGRFKRIVTSMPKRHNHFFLHRLVKRRNAYTSACYRKGKKTLLPNSKNTSHWDITTLVYISSNCYS